MSPLSGSALAKAGQIDFILSFLMYSKPLPNGAPNHLCNEVAK
jgi:hypothetical protein